MVVVKAEVATAAVVMEAVMEVVLEVVMDAERVAKVEMEVVMKVVEEVETEAAGTEVVSTSVRQSSRLWNKSRSQAHLKAAVCSCRSAGLIPERSPTRSRRSQCPRA